MEVHVSKVPLVKAHVTEGAVVEGHCFGGPVENAYVS